MRNEKTSKRIASLAAKITSADVVADLIIWHGPKMQKVSAKDIISICASATTQTADKKKAKRKIKAKAKKR